VELNRFLGRCTAIQGAANIEGRGLHLMGVRPIEGVKARELTSKKKDA
jgi:hypothetical protein